MKLFCSFFLLPLQRLWHQLNFELNNSTAIHLKQITFSAILSVGCETRPIEQDSPGRQPPRVCRAWASIKEGWLPPPFLTVSGSSTVKWFFFSPLTILSHLYPFVLIFLPFDQPLPLENRILHSVFLVGCSRCAFNSCLLAKAIGTHGDSPCALQEGRMD